MADPAFIPPLKPAPGFIDAPISTDGNTYLHELCARNAPLALIEEAILSLGANTEALNKKGLPPLALALTGNHLEAAQCMIDLGAKLSFPDGKGRNFNMLAVAINHGRDDALRFLLKNGGDRLVNALAYPEQQEAATRPYNPYYVPPKVAAAEGLPCLSLAVREGRRSQLEILVAAGAFPNQETGEPGITPLLRAAAKNDALMVEKLIELGAIIDLPQTGTGMTPLHHAAALGQAQAVEKLLQYGADVNARNKEGATPLMLAAAKGNAAMVKMLLAADADQALTDNFNKTASHYAREGKHVRLVEELEQAEALAEQKHFEEAYDKLKRKNRARRPKP
jgi:ankyrin repeat protein